MQPAEPPASSDTPPARADLGRLRIERRGDAPTRPPGLPLIRLTLLVGVLAALFLLREPLLALVSGAGGRTVRTGRAVRVVPGQAQQGDVSANGYVKADVQASLATVLSGRLVELNAKEGDTVQQGAVVARIQYDDYEIQLRQAEAAKASAQARHAQALAQTATAEARALEVHKDLGAARLTLTQLEAELAAQDEAVASAAAERDRLLREVERNRKLYEDKRIDAGAWDRLQTSARTAANAWSGARKRRAALVAGREAWQVQIERREAAATAAGLDAQAVAQAASVAQAAVEEAEQALDLARVMLEKTRIRAAFTGLVIRKDAEVGEVLAPMGAGNSRGSVLTIADPNSFEVQVELSERRIALVSEGDRAVIFLDAEPERGLPGVVRKIWPRADRSKGTIELRVTLDERPALLRPEMAARVVFKGKQAPAEAAEPYVTAPAEALLRRGPKAFVFVVEGERVRQVDVAVGGRQGARVIIERGLEGGEVLVLQPAADLGDGDRVRLGDGS